MIIFLHLSNSLKFSIVLGVIGITAAGIYAEAKSPVPAAAEVQKTSGHAKDPALLAGFEPHKALYDISLIGTKSGSQIVNVTGQMFYEWQPSCDGWISNHRFNLSYEYADSPAMHMSSDFSNFESFDGGQLDFTAQRKREGRVFEEIRGQASMDAQSSPKQDVSTAAQTIGQANYTIPKGLVFDLPKNSLFPMSHTLEVKKAIDQERRFFSSTVFDGSDEEGPVEINAFIGKKEAQIPEELLSKEGIDQEILKSKAHSIRLAFFPLNEPTPSAEYEMQMVFHDNSVISDMTVEYEDFTIRQKLSALEKIEDRCEK